MIIGHTWFGQGMEGNYYDTAIPTEGIDEVWIGEGMYDELYATVDTSITKDNVLPGGWTTTTIIDAKFNNNIEAGSINVHGHVVTKIQCYRREYQSTNTEWSLVAQWDYDKNYNTYSIIDRFVENGKTYEYAIVPVADTVMGDMVRSETIKVNYQGTFISDIDHNYAMNVNFKFGDMKYNKNTSVQGTLSGQYPIATQGRQNYRTGTATFLPLTPALEFGATNEIDEHAELLNRQEVINFLNNGKVKVIRRDDGDMLVVATNDVTLAPLSDNMDLLSNVTFSFTEIGALDYETMDKSGLIAGASKTSYSYDENGDVIWDTTDSTNADARRRYRNSFAMLANKAGGR